MGEEVPHSRQGVVALYRGQTTEACVVYLSRVIALLPHKCDM